MTGSSDPKLFSLTPNKLGPPPRLLDTFLFLISNPDCLKLNSCEEEGKRHKKIQKIADDAVEKGGEMSDEDLF